MWWLDDDVPASIEQDQTAFPHVSCDQAAILHAATPSYLVDAPEYRSQPILTYPAPRHEASEIDRLSARLAALQSTCDAKDLAAATRLATTCLEYERIIERLEARCELAEETSAKHQVEYESLEERLHSTQHQWNSDRDQWQVKLDEANQAHSDTITDAKRTSEQLVQTRRRCDDRDATIHELRAQLIQLDKENARKVTQVERDYQEHLDQVQIEHQQEVQRLHTLWKSAEQDAQKKTQSIAALNAQRTETARTHADELAEAKRAHASTTQALMTAEHARSVETRLLQTTLQLAHDRAVEKEAATARVLHEKSNEVADLQQSLHDAKLDARGRTRALRLLAADHTRLQKKRLADDAERKQLNSEIQKREAERDAHERDAREFTNQVRTLRAENATLVAGTERLEKQVDTQAVEIEQLSLALEAADQSCLVQGDTLDDLREQLASLWSNSNQLTQQIETQAAEIRQLQEARSADQKKSLGLAEAIKILEAELAARSSERDALVQEAERWSREVHQLQLACDSAEHVSTQNIAKIEGLKAALAERSASNEALVQKLAEQQQEMHRTREQQESAHRKLVEERDREIKELRTRLTVRDLEQLAFDSRIQEQSCQIQQLNDAWKAADQEAAKRKTTVDQLNERLARHNAEKAELVHRADQLASKVAQAESAGKTAARDAARFANVANASHKELARQVEENRALMRRLEHKAEEANRLHAALTAAQLVAAKRRTAMTVVIGSLAEAANQLHVQQVSRCEIQARLSQTNSEYSDSVTQLTSEKQDLEHALADSLEECERLTLQNSHLQRQADLHRQHCFEATGARIATEGKLTRLSNLHRDASVRYEADVASLQRDFRQLDASRRAAWLEADSHKKLQDQWIARSHQTIEVLESSVRRLESKADQKLATIASIKRDNAILSARLADQTREHVDQLRQLNGELHEARQLHATLEANSSQAAQRMTRLEASHQQAELKCQQLLGIVGRLRRTSHKRLAAESDKRVKVESQLKEQSRQLEELTLECSRVTADHDESLQRLNHLRQAIGESKQQIRVSEEKCQAAEAHVLQVQQEHAEQVAARAIDLKAREDEVAELRREVDRLTQVNRPLETQIARYRQQIARITMRQKEHANAIAISESNTAHWERMVATLEHNARSLQTRLSQEASARRKAESALKRMARGGENSVVEQAWVQIESDERIGRLTRRLRATETMRDIERRMAVDQILKYRARIKKLTAPSGNRAA